MQKYFFKTKTDSVCRPVPPSGSFFLCIRRAKTRKLFIGNSPLSEQYKMIPAYTDDRTKIFCFFNAAFVRKNMKQNITKKQHVIIFLKAGSLT